ncbi:MAG TPA: regulatory iron-sulfur-containing complex subunit RicT [Phycisphaerae bacterium]|nr:regulatory iron-sulfur-containing complex subunit RicT [Phycisphaerae bacterium]
MNDDTRTPPDAPPEAAAPPEELAPPGEAAPPDAEEKDLDEQDEPGREEKRVVVRYGRMANLGMLRHHLDTPPPPGTQLVIRTIRGTELGQVLVNVGEGPRCSFIDKQMLESYLRTTGGDSPIYRGGRVLRLANAQDLNDQAHLQRAAAEKAAVCEETIAHLKLQMKLVCVEHLLGGERIVFYFAAEHRVDFRELVRQLAGQYHTRIEMRQVGARDEARLIADYERCGMQCCCQTYLKFLKPISMRMAKTQKATLDPTKISGRCGRLMCCLRYEDATYEDLIKSLPRKNTWVRTADGVLGKVMDTQTLTQLVRLMLANRTQEMVRVEDVAERNLPEPTTEELAAAVRRRPQPRLEAPTLERAVEPPPVPEAAEAAGPPAEAPDETLPKRPRKRRGRRRKKDAAPQAGANAAAATPAAGQAGPGAPPARPGDRPARKRRRGRRKGKGGGDGGGDAPAPQG